MTKVFVSSPRKTAQPLAVGITPLMVTATTSFCMAGKQWRQSSGRASGPLFEAEEMDAPGAGLLEHGGPVEEDDLAGFERGGGELGLAHGLEGAETEARDVEAKILVRLHGFHEEGIVGLEGAGAAEHFIGALERFDGEHGALADNAALPDVEASTLPRNVDAVLEVVRLDGKLFPRHATKAGEVIVEKCAGVEQRDAERLDLLRDGAKNSSGIAQ